MKRKIAPQDNASNIVNPNNGASGTNPQYDQNQGNRGEQLNPNRSVSASGEPSYGSESDLLSNLIKKHFGTSTTAPAAPVSSAPTNEGDDIDQGDVYYYDGCGD